VQDDRAGAVDAQVYRRARNQTLFREVNDRILDVNDPLEQHREAEFLCECSVENCLATVQLSADEYRSVRADPTHFVTAVGHVEPSLDRLVEPGERFWIVETLPGEPSRLAQEAAGNNL
jgi:hypothetical protein